MWESGHWLWLCICGPPGLPAASIWALPELAISCKWGRHSAMLAQDWLPVSLLIWALWLFFSVFLTSPLPEVFDLCKYRVPRQGMVTCLQLSLQYWPTVASSVFFAKTNRTYGGQSYIWAETQNHIARFMNVKWGIFGSLFHQHFLHNWSLKVNSVGRKKISK